MAVGNSLLIVGATGAGPLDLAYAVVTSPPSCILDGSSSNGYLVTTTSPVPVVLTGFEFFNSDKIALFTSGGQVTVRHTTFVKINSGTNHRGGLAARNGAWRSCCISFRWMANAAFSFRRGRAPHLRWLHERFGI